MCLTSNWITLGHNQDVNGTVAPLVLSYHADHCFELWLIRLTLYKTIDYFPSLAACIILSDSLESSAQEGGFQVRPNLNHLASFSLHRCVFSNTDFPSILGGYQGQEHQTTLFSEKGYNEQNLISCLTFMLLLMILFIHMKKIHS